MAAKMILIVDDQELMVSVLEALFAEGGYRTMSAPHGVAALALLETTRPDLILTDLAMPVLDGVGLCRAVQADPATQTIPIILMSATRDVRFTINVPYAAFLLKPFDLNMLLSLVTGLIGTACTYE